MPAEEVFLFVMSGQFWFAAFLSLLTAFLIEGGFGYGRGYGKGGLIYLDSNRARLELVVMFVIGLLAYSALVQAGLAVLA